MTSEVKCGFCSKLVLKSDALQHLKKCLRQDIPDHPFVNSGLNFKVFTKYYLFAYVLNIIQEWVRARPLSCECQFFVQQLYLYFYYIVKDDRKIELICVDDFLKAVLESIQTPEDYYLQIVPNLDKKFYLDGPLKDALFLIFSRAQIHDLKNGEAFHS